MTITLSGFADEISRFHPGRTIPEIDPERTGYLLALTLPARPAKLRGAPMPGKALSFRGV
jgi:hypothetical protein